MFSEWKGTCEAALHPLKDTVAQVTKEGCGIIFIYFFGRTFSWGCRNISVRVSPFIFVFKCIDVCVWYTLYIRVFLFLTAHRAHRSSRSLSRQIWNIRLVYEAASPTSRTRRTPTCGETSCVETSRLNASPPWPLRSVIQTFKLIAASSTGCTVRAWFKVRLWLWTRECITSVRAREKF